MIVLWFGSFKFVENAAALLGLAIVVFVVAAFKLATPWDQVARQAVLPLIPPDQGHRQALAAYGFSAIALLGALIAPYEVAFYSSGAIEERWGGTDIITNRVTAIVGIGFGALITVAMIVVAAQTFYAHGVQSQTFVGIRLPLVYTLGKVGLGAFLVGAFADCNGFKGGKVDDLLLELRAGEPPVVRAIITQQGAGPRPRAPDRAAERLAARVGAGAGAGGHARRDRLGARHAHRRDRAY